MAKISSFVDGGDPQAADQFVVARGGLNLKLLWSSIEAYLDTLFAAIGTAVTGGDLHDHSGGDGAQINHTTLSNIGTYTHAQIDTHIAAGGYEWTEVKKTASESVTSDTTLSTDAELVKVLSASTTYIFRGRIWFDTPAAADLKFRFVCTSTTFYIKYTSYPAGSTTGTVGIDTSSPGTTVAVTGTGTTGGYIEFDGFVVIDGSDRAWGFQWAQNTSNASPTTVLKGSYAEFVEV